MQTADLTRIDLYLCDEAMTVRLGAVLARVLHPGLALLLRGEIGAGKTHLARALIRERLGRMEDVPSPSFTLVQVYDDVGGDIWHVDLYRLGHPDEVGELGLDASFDSAICVVEWPERLGQRLPGQAIDLRLTDQGDGRLATLTATPALIAQIVVAWAASDTAGGSDDTA